VRGRRQDIAIRDDKIHRIGRDLDPAGHATIGVPDTLVLHRPRPASSLDARQMKRVGLIGCGAIGRPVARALLAGKAGSHSLAAVLARAPRDLDGFPVTDTADRFLAGGHDLIIEAGGPAAFRALVPAALERCEVWAVSPVPLADPLLGREIRGISGQGEASFVVRAVSRRASGTSRHTKAIENRMPSADKTDGSPHASIP